MMYGMIDLGLHKILTQLQIESYHYSKENQRFNLGLTQYHYNQDNIVDSFKVFYNVFHVKNQNKCAIITNAVDLIRNQYRYSEMQLLRNETNMYTLTEIETRLKRTLDVYINGVRIYNDEIELFIAENNTVLIIPKEHIPDVDDIDVNINNRTYINEYRTEVNEFNSLIIPMKYKKMTHNIYCDGLLITDYNRVEENNEIVLKFVKDYTDKELYVSIVKSIRMHYNIPAASQHFQIEDIKGTVVPENISLFSDGYLQRCEIENPYPNIFSLPSHLIGEDKIVQVFYKNTHLQYFHDPILKYDKLFNLLNQMDEQTVPRFIREYTISPVGYKMNNYLDNYSELDLYEFQKYLFGAKIKHDPFNYIKYLDILGLADAPRVIEMEKKEYESYLRYDNKKEIMNHKLQREFKKEKVVIAFGNPINSSFNIFIDGLITKEYDEFFESRITYLYFDKDIIKPDTVIEIDVYRNIPDLSVHIDYTLTEDMQEDDIEISKLLIISLDDLAAFVYDEVRKCYMASDLITFSLVNNQITISHDESLIGRQIKLVNTWIALNQNFDISRSNSAFTSNRITNRIDMRQFEYCKKDNNYYTVFLNGRYVDKNEFHIDYPSPDNLNTRTIFRATRLAFERHDIPKIQYHPFKKPTVERIDEVSESGIVYLRNLPTPFSLKYYDVFLNGRKLNSTNISIITDKVIALRNVSARGPLYVLGRYKTLELPHEEIYHNNALELIVDREDKTIQHIFDLFIIALEAAMNNNEFVESFERDEIGTITVDPDIIDKIIEIFKPEELFTEGEIEEEDPYDKFIDNAILVLWYELYIYMNEMAFRKEGVVNTNIIFDNHDFISRFYPLIKNGKIPLNMNRHGMLIRMPINANKVNDDIIAGEFYDRMYRQINDIIASGQKIINANTYHNNEVMQDFTPLIKRGKIAINANRAIMSERIAIDANTNIPINTNNTSIPINMNEDPDNNQ